MEDTSDIRELLKQLVPNVPDTYVEKMVQTPAVTELIEKIKVQSPESAVSDAEQTQETKELRKQLVKELLRQIMPYAPIINIGFTGHVSNGKSSITKALSGKSTQKFSAEQKKGITVMLGHAGVKIWRSPGCPAPKCYVSGPSHEMSKICPHTGMEMELVMHASIVDCPGHHMLTSTMWSGTCVMDYTVLVESVANKTIPAEQTWEHMVATTMAGIPNLAVCLNKVDLLSKKSSAKREIGNKVTELRTFLKKYGCDKPVIPTSPIFDINMDVLCEVIASAEIPDRTLDTYCKMICIRSFDINKPKRITKGVNLKGGIVGGSVVNGSVKVGDVMTIYPGHIESTGTDETTYVVDEDEDDESSTGSSGKKKKKRKKKDQIKEKLPYTVWSYQPIECTVLSISTETTSLGAAYPGGLVAVQLDIDPGHARGNGLVGNIIVPRDGGHDIRGSSWVTLQIESFFPNKDDTITERSFKGGDRLGLSINAYNVIGTVKKYKKDKKQITLVLSKPIAVSPDSTIVLTEHIKRNDTGRIIAKCSVKSAKECTRLC